MDEIDRTTLQAAASLLRKLAEAEARGIEVMERLPKPSIFQRTLGQFLPPVGVEPDVIKGLATHLEAMSKGAKVHRVSREEYEALRRLAE